MRLVRGLVPDPKRGRRPPRAMPLVIEEHTETDDTGRDWRVVVFAPTKQQLARTQRRGRKTSTAPSAVGDADALRQGEGAGIFNDLAPDPVPKAFDFLTTTEGLDEYLPKGIGDEGTEPTSG